MKYLYTCVSVSFAIICVMSSCNSRHKINIKSATDSGYEFAGRYLSDTITDMQRHELLLDVRSREYQLRVEKYDEAADAFINAFCDSINRNK